MNTDSTPLDVDALAQEIRRVDGSHSMGAGALAEALLPFIRSHLATTAPAAQPQGAEPLAWRYSRNNGKTWHLAEYDPTEVMPDVGGLVVPLVAAPQPAAVAGDGGIQAAQDAFRAGWTAASLWALRDDLIADVGSPAYLKDMAAALSGITNKAAGGGT